MRRWSRRWQRAKICATRKPMGCPANPSRGTTWISRSRTTADTATRTPTQNGHQSHSRRSTVAAATTWRPALRGRLARITPHRSHHHHHLLPRSTASLILTALATTVCALMAPANATWGGVAQCALLSTLCQGPAVWPTLIRSGRGEALLSWKRPVHLMAVVWSIIFSLRG